MKQDRPSATARFVAQGVWSVSRHPRLKAEVPRDIAEANERMVGISGAGRRRRLLRRAAIYQALSVPGIYLHFVLRKRHIELQVRAAIESGATQVVVLGAGFDTLAIRLSGEFPGVSWIEADHPATQQVKHEAIGRHFPDSAVRLLELDHERQPLRETLLASEIFDPAAVSVFIAEGLFMYLAEESVDEILGCVRESSKAGSRLIFTFMDERAPGDFQFRNATALTNLWLGISGEKFTWGLPVDRLEPFLSERGFNLANLATSDDLAALLSPQNHDAKPAIGECVATALKS